MTAPIAPIVSVDPRTGLAVEEVSPGDTPDDVARVVDAATGASGPLAALPVTARARILDAMADELEGRRPVLVALADRETALGLPRLEGELTRTIYQLRFLGDVIRDGAYRGVVVDHPHDTPMGALPDIRRWLVPIGPIAMFSASNFPFAFSVPGGDTAAALAAGCPVVVKVHHSHAATSEAVFTTLTEAGLAAGAPEGFLGRVHGRGAGISLVRHPGIRAVAFTGSTAGGRALFDLAAARPDPIPFFGELGSLNPLAVTPRAAAERAREIGEGWAASFTLGSGQFCTKPGIAFVPQGPDGDALRDAALARAGASGTTWMLNEAMHGAYLVGAVRLGAVPGAIVHASPAVEEADGFAVTPTLVETTTAALAGYRSPLLDECFGPAGVIVRYADESDLLAAFASMEGSLTASIHIGDGETELPARLLQIGAGFAGRVLVNAYPTGVAVTWAMQHGGPWPASTNAAHTSVGAASIDRFLRPVAFQNVPQALLPPELRDLVDGTGPGAGTAAAGADMPRRVDGHMRLA